MNLIDPTQPRHYFGAYVAFSFAIDETMPLSTQHPHGDLLKLLFITEYDLST